MQVLQKRVQNPPETVNEVVEKLLEYEPHGGLASYFETNPTQNKFLYPWAKHIGQYGAPTYILVQIISLQRIENQLAFGYI